MDENANTPAAAGSAKGKPAKRKHADLIGKFWDDHVSGRPVDDRDAVAICHMPFQPISDFHRDRVGRMRRIRFRDLGPRHKSWPAVTIPDEIDPAFFPAMKQFLSRETGWERYMAEARYASEDARKTACSNENPNGYQIRAVRDGLLRVPDPLTGELRPALDGFQAYGRTCYLVYGRELFYFISAGAGGKALCMYLPGRNILIDLEANLNKLLEPDLTVTTLLMVTRRIAREAAGYNALLARMADGGIGRRGIVVGMQNAQNFAHHYWNYYTGLEKLVIAGHHAGVTRVLFASSEFFGPLAGLYPEFADRIERHAGGGAYDPCPFSQTEFYLTVGGYFIPETLRSRVRATMAKLQPADAPAFPDGHPVVWIGLRLGDKSWVDQDREVPALIDRLFETYPNAVVLLDGFSFPVGADEISGEWAPITNRLTEIARTIAERTSAPERVVSMIGNTLAESVLWAARVDAYIAPIGTTQHKIGWFTDAPGIVYHPSHGDKVLRRERMPGAWEAEGTSVPFYVAGTPVEPGERRGSGDRRQHIENMVLPTAELADRLLAMLAVRLGTAAAPAEPAPDSSSA